MTTPTAVSSSGAPPVGALTASRAKSAPARTDGFAQILDDINGGEVMSVGTGGSAATASPDQLAGCDSTESVQETHVVVSETTVPVDGVTPMDAWHTLAMAWSAATSEATQVVDAEGEGEPDADGALRGGAGTHAVDEPGIRTARLIRLFEPGDGPVPKATSAGLDPDGVGCPHLDVDAGPTNAPAVEAVPPDASLGSAAERLFGMPATDKPSRDMPAESLRSHDRPPPSSTGVASPAPDGGQEAIATAATVPPLSTDRVDVTPGSRQSDLALSLPEALAVVAVQPTVRAATDIGFDAVIEAASPSTSDTAAAVVDQVVKSMRLQWKNGLGEARIQLRPEHLGPVEISIKVDGGSITAVVRAESSQVQDWIVSHQQSLRQQLEAAGLRLDDLVVTPDAERRRQGEHADEQRQSAARRRRADGTAPTFEVIV